MFPLGHLGIGYKLVQPLRKGLPPIFILLGTVLPDLVDKPLYLVGRFLGWSELIPGTRSFGHTGLAVLGIASVALIKKSKPLAALSLGMASHLLLDGLSDQFILGGSTWVNDGLLWPFSGHAFPALTTTSLQGHLSKIRHPIIVAGEVLGVIALGWEFHKMKGRKFYKG
jgi:hypothetical protein